MGIVSPPEGYAPTGRGISEQGDTGRPGPRRVRPKRLARWVPEQRPLGAPIPRRYPWKRAHTPKRRRIARPEQMRGPLVRPSARISMGHLATTVVVVAVVWTVGALWQTLFAQRIYPHVTIDRVPVGGMTRGEALAALRDSARGRMSAPIEVDAAGKKWTVTATRFGASYDITSTVDRALALDHHGAFLVGGWNEARTVIAGSDVALSGTHNRGSVDAFLSGVAREVRVSSRAAAVGIHDADVTILREPIPGHQLDLSLAARVLGQAIDIHNRGPIDLPLQRLDSALGHPQAVAAVHQADALLAAPIQFQWTAGSNQSWQLKPDGILRLLTFTPRCYPGYCSFDLGINLPKLAATLNKGGVAASVDRPATPASFDLYTASDPSAPASVRVLPESAGVTIDVANTARQMLQQGSVPVGTGRIIFLPTLPVYPAFTAKVAQAMNFDTNIGRSYFFVPETDWAHLRNIGQASNIISNTIVQPGQTFDLVKAAGPFTAARGYSPGHNAITPNDIDGVNGGVNQVASAVLGAAYDAGLPIERHDHYPYLSIFTPPGLDAMVIYNGKDTSGASDLVFRNTTDHPLLVMTYTDGQGGVGAYLFDSAGYAPDHVRGTYTSMVAGPTITLNQDGSVDTTRTRTIDTGGHTTSDTLSSHSVSIDP